MKLSESLDIEVIGQTDQRIVVDCEVELRAGIDLIGLSVEESQSGHVVALNIDIMG